MRIKTLAFGCVVFLVNFYSLQSFSQNIITEEIKDRYLIIDDFSKFFTEKDGNFTTESFQLYNIFEEESSKPIHVGIIEIPNVVKFSIESSSSVYENQRRCKLTIRKENYLSTFIKVLSIMDVQYIVTNGEIRKVEDFLKLYY
jgi:hypothetical protein